MTVMEMETAQREDPVFVRTVPEVDAGHQRERESDSEQTYVCEICQDFFPSQRGLNIHMGHKHPEQAEGSKRPRSRRAASAPASASDVEGSVNRSSRPDRPDFASLGSKPSRSAKPVQQFILHEVNDGIITGLGLLGVPEQIARAKILENGTKSVADVVQFSTREATIIAEGAVRMKATPVAETVGRIAGPAVPYVFGFFALLVIASHVLRLIALRRYLAQLVQPMQPQASSGAETNGASGSTAHKPVFV